MLLVVFLALRILVLSHYYLIETQVKFQRYFIWNLNLNNLVFEDLFNSLLSLGLLNFKSVQIYPTWYLNLFKLIKSPLLKASIDSFILWILPFFSWTFFLLLLVLLKWVQKCQMAIVLENLQRTWFEILL